MQQEHHRLVAAFRWSVIAPLLRPDLDPDERRRLRQGIIEKQDHADPVRGPRTIGPSTLRRWLNAYKRKGIEGLCPRPRSDLGGLKAYPAAVVERAIELRRESPRRTVEALAEHLSEEYPELTIARSTLDRHLRQRGWSRRALGTTAAPFIPFEAPYRGALYTGDVLHGPEVITEKGEVVRVKIFGWIDDWSRLMVSLRGYSDERLAALEDSLRRAMQHYAVPDQIFLDNAKIFSSTQLALTCGTLGIVKTHSTPGYAPSRGKIERFFRHLRERFLCEIEALDPLPLEDFNRYLGAWGETSYNERVHSRTKQSPRDRWDGSEVPVRTLSARQIHEAFLHWDRRKVGPAGEIKLHGNIYYADPTLAGQTVVLRFDPMNLGEAYIHRNGRPLERITTERLVTRQLLRSPKASEAKASKAARRFLDKISVEHEQQLARESRLIRMQDIPQEQEEDEL